MVRLRRRELLAQRRETQRARLIARLIARLVAPRLVGGQTLEQLGEARVLLGAAARQRAPRAPARRCAKARFHSPSARPRSSAEASALNSGSHAATSPYACHGASETPASAGLNGGGLSAADGRFESRAARFEGSRTFETTRVVVPAASSASTSATSESRNSIADHAWSFASWSFASLSSRPASSLRSARSECRKRAPRGDGTARAPCERRGKQVGAARGESLFVDR